MNRSILATNQLLRGRISEIHDTSHMSFFLKKKKHRIYEVIEVANSIIVIMLKTIKLIYIKSKHTYVKFPN